jgi:integrase
VVELRPGYVDLDGLMICPAQQAGGAPLKTEMSETAVPIPAELAGVLAEHMNAFPRETVLTDGLGGPSSTWAVERATRTARRKVPTLPEGFRFHDLRHHYASALIAAGLDVKVIQARLRHGSAKTTLEPMAT